MSDQIGAANSDAATSTNCTDVLRTTADGVPWTQRGMIATPPGQLLNQIKFANSDVGYAVVANGQSAACMTLDGGDGWQLMPGPPVADFKVAGGNEVAVRFDHSGCPRPRTWTIDAAPIGTTQWRTTINPPDNQGNHVSVQPGTPYLSHSLIAILDPALSGVLYRPSSWIGLGHKRKFDA